MARPKVPYKASKAWHFSSELRADLLALSGHIKQAGEADLAQRLVATAGRVPAHLTESYQQAVETEKEHCYSRAHEAALELQSHLALLTELEIINNKTLKRWQRQAETVVQQLSGLLPEAQPAIVNAAIKEEANGTIDNQSEEGDGLPVRRPAVPGRGLQSKSDGARRINRQRPHQEPPRRQSPRENIQG